MVSNLTPKPLTPNEVFFIHRVCKTLGFSSQGILGDKANFVGVRVKGLQNPFNERSYIADMAKRHLHINITLEKKKRIGDFYEVFILKI